MLSRLIHRLSSYQNSDASDSTNLNQSILNHLFLSYNLPSSNDDDYLIKSNHQNEYKLLELLNQFFESLDGKKTLPIFRNLKNCIQRWSVLQNPNKFTVPNLRSTIEKLDPGDFLPIYFHAQNAAILIEVDHNPPNQTLICAWQVALPTETITSSLESHVSCFPVPTFRLSDHSQLLSQTQCELLIDFMTNTIEYAKVIKSSNTFNEMREVPVAHYVCQWWISQFHNIEKVKPSIKFQKKHRDQIRWKSSNLPFRRSGLWMAIKVVFQTILTKSLGTTGTIAYKLLITYFLTYVIHQRQISPESRLSTDILIHCLRKIERRLNKIEGSLSSIDSDDISDWMECITDTIRQMIQHITPNLDWQKGIEKEDKQKSSNVQLDLDQPDTYQHSFPKLKIYLDKHQYPTKAYKQSSNSSDSYSRMMGRIIDADTEDPLPSVRGRNHLSHDTTGTDLTYVENWIQSNLRAWISRSENVSKRFEDIQSFYENYQRVALEHYYSDNKPSDPIGYSRFLLTSLTILHLMHQKLCSNQRFERLKLHTIQIPHLIDLFEFLVLPNREEMIRARELYDYFGEFSEKPYPDLLSSIESKDAFGVNFAHQSEEMNETLRKIVAQIQSDKNQKINEVEEQKKRYEQLMQKAQRLICRCDPEFPYNKCEQCSLYREARNVKVSIYEYPIPAERESALAVIFELEMPNEIRCYRDILWQFINRPNSQPSHNMYEWLSTPPHCTMLQRFYKGSSKCRVKLISSRKSVTQTHYSIPQPVATTPSEDYIRKSGLRVQISPTKPMSFQNECLILTPQLTDPNYKDLQFSLDNTLFVQNRVIADLSKCSLLLKPTEFVEFGSFRSGHRLQWWNLLCMLELDSLSMDDESVAILIHHTLLQNGPMAVDPKALICSWCPEAHQLLLEDHFVDELIAKLGRRLKDCESNWQDELILVIITIIVMRIFTICNITRKDQVRILVLKCRNMAEKWIELILESIHKPSGTECEKLDALREKIVVIGTASLLTFSMFTEQSDDLELSKQDIVTLLKITTNIHDNLILNKKQIDSSVFMRNLMRCTERILVSIHLIVNECLERTSFESLNEFAAIYWAVVRSKGLIDGNWKKREKEIYDGWYDGQYESIPVSIDLLRGIFLVNETTIKFLPDKITSNELFRRVFGNHIFEVHAAESEDTYITKYGYHDHGKVYYEFQEEPFMGDFTVYERHDQTNVRFRLIPPKCFEGELADIFISNYSHWFDEANQRVEFRPIHFQNSNFLIDKHYILKVDKGYITTKNFGSRQLLINRSSPFYQEFFLRYFVRLDEESYVHMLRSKSFVNIHLVRLGIAFKYDIGRKLIISREFSDMYVDENQWFGTLTGLKSGLLLSTRAATNQSQDIHLCRKLIVPFGQVQTTKTSESSHQTVTIDRKSSTLHQYFVFILNDRLRVLQSIDSPTGWLYLALLHAMTSHTLPDSYTGMTGMERAFQLLNSAGCWSDQPFDSVSLDILLQLANISPKVKYYPPSLTWMAKIEWNHSNFSYSLQHFGYYLIVKKLVQASEQWSFMYPGTDSQELTRLFESKKYDEQLLAKLYWDYRDSYNPIARLSAQMEAEIRSINTAKYYQPVLENDSLQMNYNQINLVSNLYYNGDANLKDSSTLHCFPLSRWLTSEYKFKNIWIGLFKVIEELKVNKSPNEIERFELLLDFLHYTSNKCSIRPYYLQLLRSIFKSSITPLRSVPYPSFTNYEKIHETSFQPLRVIFPQSLWASSRLEALGEIRRCFEKKVPYTNRGFPQINIDERKINDLFESWRSNAKLRSFLENLQNHIDPVELVPLHSRVLVRAQQFTVRTFQQHYQMPLHLQDNQIDPQLLQNAQRKFLHPNSDHSIKPTVCTPILNEQREFPEEIFPAIDVLSEIVDHFKSHLNTSWKQLQATEESTKKYPSINEIKQYLRSSRQESEQLWNELVRSITTKHELLFTIGSMLRILPTTLISVFQQMWLNERSQSPSHDHWSPLFLTIEQRTLFGGLMVNWIVEQQIERALHLAKQEKTEDFEKEISNIPHVNWTPSEHVPWLILELEMNITIREIQVKVARHMMGEENSSIGNFVMQMNMGEGKTSVILPMLALSLGSSSTNLVRIIVLKSLFPMNYQSLRYKLGGLLNRRVLPFACRRDMNFNDAQANEIFARLQSGLTNRDVVLTSPEDILSFDLLTIDKCRRKEFNVGRTMLSTQQWLTAVVRDILDESDEILHVKYQLVYSIGRQQQVDAGIARWKTVQTVLSFVKQHAASIAQKYPNDVFYKTTERQSSFSEFRLLNHQPFVELCQRIVRDWLDQTISHQLDQPQISSFILNTDASIDSLPNHLQHETIQLLLILRGLLSSEVLLAALRKRHRVNYGVNCTPKFNRLMAVPFRAKDVAADNTEFGHPDMAIVLTQLSYYYSGLNDEQMLQCFNRLNQDESDPDLIYDQWISLETNNERIASIKQWKRINLKDSHQRTRILFPTLRYNMSLVNYFLDHFVFPYEAKQFPHKLVASAWDLSSSARQNIITGFSGTNDTQLLLPVHIRQYDLPELQKTDAIVLNNLLRPENENYQCLPLSATSSQILTEIVNSELIIHVIIDVGALFIDGTNRQTAVKWLNLSNKDTIDYAIYFDSDSLLVCDRQYQHQAFLTSPASERLDRCVFYLDEIHTRGTDFKFPNEFRAAVTLGNSLTKDRLVQACMRMRKLGEHHWLSFWSSNEVHQQIQLLKKDNSHDRIHLTDIIRWVYGNTQHATWEGFHHWAAQSLSFQRKMAAFRTIHSMDSQISLTNSMMGNFARECLEAEVLELKSMYGPSKTFQTIAEIYSAKYEHSSLDASDKIHQAVSKQLENFSGRKKLLTQLLDEEQQRELEREREQEQEEERQQKRALPARPCEPVLHEEIKSLCDMHGPMLNLSDFPSVFYPLSKAFRGTSFYRECQPQCWQENLWVSSTFKRVIEAQGEPLGSFLRSPRWIVVYRNSHLIFVSAYEANWLMGRLYFLHHNRTLNGPSTTTLRLLLPRTKRDQSIFINQTALTMPPSIESKYGGAAAFPIPVRWLAELLIFNGSLYFESNDEQTAYCQCLGLCPKPRTPAEEEAFEKNWIAIDGYVHKLEHRSALQLDQCRFRSNPLAFIRKLVENRNHIHAPLISHVGSIISNARKLSIS